MATANLESLQSYLQAERGIAASRASKFNRLKCEINETVYFRFLPVQMGPNKRPFARYAQHWCNKVPMLCVCQTEEAFGGNPKAPCRGCELEREFLQHRDKAIHEAARKTGAFPQWMTYVFVWEIVDPRNVSHKPDDPYVLFQHELRRDAFTDISNTWFRSCERNPPYGFMDPLTGADWTVRRNAQKHLKYNREDVQPIMEGKTADEILDFIDKKMDEIAPGGMPACIPEPPTEDEETSWVEKAEEFIMRAASSGTAGRGARTRSAVDVSEDEPAPSRRAAATEAPSRRRAEPEEQAAPAEEAAPARRRTEAAAPAEEAPRRRAEPQAEAPRTAPAAPSRRAAPEKVDVAAVTRAATPEATGTNPGDFEEQPEPGAEGAESAAQPAAEEEPPPPVSTGRRTPPAPPARRTGTAAAPAGGKIEDDPEALAPEKRDPAPAASRRASSAPQQRLSTELASRVSRLNTNSLQ